MELQRGQDGIPPPASPLHRRSGVNLNTWKVLWEPRENHRKVKKFPGDSPKEAVEFAKRLKTKGRVVLGVISCRKAYAPPKDKEKPDQYGIMWCPYCVKWRAFDIMGKYLGSVLLPPDLRCPVCTVSINEYWVRFFNPLIAARFINKVGE